jgi:hypothetical protein
MKRSEIKDAHENSVLESFKKFYLDIGNTIEIIEKPEPPDAIAIINGSKTWIEITDAFFSPELAESITTYAAEDKTHKPVPKANRFVMTPDTQFSNVLVNVIKKKYDKKSIGKIYKKFGSGILLVGIINPFSYSEELVKTERQRILDSIKTKEKRFFEIYFYEVNTHEFHQLI